MTIKFAVIMSHPTQHFAPLYAHLAKQPGVELHVFFIAENGLEQSHDAQFGIDVKWDVPLVGGYNYTILNKGLVVEDFAYRTIDSPNLVPAIESFSPNFIWLHGYSYRANWRAVKQFKGRAEFIYSSDSNANIVVPWYKQFIKKIVVGRFFRYMDYFLSISPSNRAYLLGFGVKSEKVIDTSFPIDISRFDEQRNTLTKESVSLLKSSLNISPDHRVIIVVGKLLPRKRVADVLRAIPKLSGNKVHLVIVGSGECECDLRALSSELKVVTQISFVGFVNQSELPLYFEMADLLVFPSEGEPYGAIVSETLSFGLPVILASGIGCIGSSAIDGFNASVYKMGDVGDLVKKIDALFGNLTQFDEYGHNSISLAPRHDLSQMSCSIVDICVDSELD